MSYETGLEQFRSQDYAGAAESFKFAIENGGLNSDSYETATVHLAECLARTGQASEALEILQKLEPGVCEFAAFHRVRSFVYEKLGQVAEANAEFRRAQGYQRNLQKLK